MEAQKRTIPFGLTEGFKKAAYQESAGQDRATFESTWRFAAMVGIVRFVFGGSALLENTHKPIGEITTRGVEGLGFDVSISAEDLPAELALDNGVIGWVVLSNGHSSALEALQIHDNLVVSHRVSPGAEPKSLSA